jgi:hypothetical protein
LTDKGTVCIGYATLYNTIVSKLGLNCRFVEGLVRNNKYESHAWNVVELDGKWYCVDTTWGDSGSADKYFLKSMNTFKSKEYGVHESNVYNSLIEAGEIFADTDYNGIDSLENHSLLPSVYNIKMDVLRINTLKIGETYKFMIVNPDNITMSFTSSNSDVISIDEKGVVTGVDVGVVTIVAYNDELDIKQTCEITVTK